MIPESFSELRVDVAERSAFRRTWNLFMMPADVAAFSDALKAAFPDIRFISREYWRQYSDAKRCRADGRESDRRHKLGLPRLPFNWHMRDPTREPLRYWDSLADPSERFYIAWIEPPGWKPVWTPPHTDGVRYVANAPRLWFDLHHGHFEWPRDTYNHYSEPEHINARESLLLAGNTFEVRWHPGDGEAEAFGKKVYNILRRLTVSRFLVFSIEDRKAFRREAHDLRTLCLAGDHAAAWALKRRHNYFKCSNWAARLKPVTYPLRRRDVYTPAEYKRYVADEEKRFQEFARAHMEEVKRQAQERAESGKPATLDILVEGGGALSNLKMRIPVGTVPPRKRNRTTS